jgi:transaldolase
MQELGETHGTVVVKHLDAAKAKEHNKIPKVVHTESSFRWAMNEDEMATIKTAEGIRNFAKDLAKLEAQISAQIK